MDDDKKPNVRRPVVLRKLNADNLYLIERGLLGDLPNKLKERAKPPLVPTRDQCSALDVAKPSGILSACLQVFPESPVSERVSSSDEEGPSSLKKSFSFRDRLSRISFFGKEKDKPKSILESQNKEDLKDILATSEAVLDKRDSNKINKRSWFFRTKEFAKRKEHIPIYKRSKSFEFLPKAIEEEDEELSPGLKKNLSFGGSSDTMGEAWSSNESLEYISNVYTDRDNGVHLKSFKELACDDSHKSSQLSTGSTWTTGSSSNDNTENLLKTESVENVFEEFHKAVELFSENYSSDCEPYTKSNQMTIKQKRMSSSFSNLPSPKVVQANKPSEISVDFKRQLAKVLSVKRDMQPCRRGSGTDCFVLEDHKGDENRYKRGQKKAINRVRRMSSTKYKGAVNLGFRERKSLIN